jgi:hypothetical protein
MTKKVLVAILALFSLLSAFGADKAQKEKKEVDRLNESAVVLHEILGMPEGIPKRLAE